MVLASFKTVVERNKYRVWVTRKHVIVSAAQWIFTDVSRAGGMSAFACPSNELQTNVAVGLEKCTINCYCASTKPSTLPN